MACQIVCSTAPPPSVRFVPLHPSSLVKHPTFQKLWLPTTPGWLGASQPAVSQLQGLISRRTQSATTAMQSVLRTQHGIEMEEEVKTVRVIGQRLFGPHDVSKALELLTITKPEGAAAGHVLVCLKARPVHPYVDLVLIRNSLLQGLVGKVDGRQIVPGSEGVGVVESVGEGVKCVKKGDRVVPILWNSLLAKGQGSWQEYIEVAEEDLVLLPDEISDDDAAQFVINPWTAYGLLKDLGAPRGSYILQTGAGSIVGRLVIQLAKHWGIKTINVVEEEALKEELKALGADEVINSKTEDVVKKVKQLTHGQGAHGAIEMGGASQTKIAAASVKSGGNVFSIGGTYLTILFDLERNVRLSFWSLTHFAGDKKHRKKIAEDMLELFKEKIIKLPAVNEDNKVNLKDYVKAIEKSDYSAGMVLLDNIVHDKQPTPTIGY